MTGSHRFGRPAAGPLWRSLKPHPRSETVSSIPASEMLWTANVICTVRVSPGEVRRIPLCPSLHPRARGKTEEVPGWSTPPLAISRGGWAGKVAPAWVPGDRCRSGKRRAKRRTSPGRGLAPSCAVSERRGRGQWRPDAVWVEQRSHRG